MKLFERNKAAFLNPQPGDYWNEHFIPYFLIVKKIGNLFIVLNKTISEKEGWRFDLSRPSVYSIYDIENEVKYSSAIGKPIDESKPTFVADVFQNERYKKIIEEYEAIEKEKQHINKIKKLIARKRKQLRFVKKYPELGFIFSLYYLNYNYKEVILGDFILDELLSKNPIFIPKIKLITTINGVSFCKFLNGEWTKEEYKMYNNDFNHYLADTCWLTNVKIK
jgi:hypothetical protein